MSNSLRAASLALIAWSTLACGEMSSPDSEATSTVQVAQPEAASAAWPMPSLNTRIVAVVEALGPELEVIRGDLEMNGGRLRNDRRAILRKLSPKARGVLRRHHVQLVHIAQHLKRGSK